MFVQQLKGPSLVAYMTSLISSLCEDITLSPHVKISWVCTVREIFVIHFGDDTCNRCQARENAYEQVTPIGPGWLRKGRAPFKPIHQRVVIQNQNPNKFSHLT